VLRRLLEFNYDLSAKLDRVWAYPLAHTFWHSYSLRAASMAQLARPPRVVDVGAGRETPYAAEFERGSVEVIGVDVLADDLEVNPSLNQWIARDVIRDGLPPEAMNAGLITSRMVIEHMPDLDRFASEVYSALAPGGKTIHLFAARYSLFAIVNRLLPESLSKWILFKLRPESAEVGGFTTYYDRTHAEAAGKVFRAAGLVRVETEVSYEVAPYFRFCFPLFVGARIWETTLHRLGLKNTGGYVLLTAERPAT
jgi:SAM-dependent methyltransferase